MVTQKTTKAPLFRGIDLTIDSCDIMAYLVTRMEFRPDNIRLDDSLHAAERAYALVQSEGLPFREAYRRVAADYAGGGG